MYQPSGPMRASGPTPVIPVSAFVITVTTAISTTTSVRSDRNYFTLFNLFPYS
jgi:hypothetical protein